MKKYLIFFWLAFISVNIAAQTQFGIRFSPTIQSLRYESDIDSIDLESNGNSVRFITGIYFDRYIGGNAFLSLGLNYSPQKVKFRINNTTDQTYFEESHNLQYLMIPASIKLFTNEISLDTKLYFQIGTQLEVKIHEENVKTNEIYVRNFKRLGGSLILSTGIEKRVSINGNVYLGFTYHRGLLSVIADQFPIDEGIRIKKDLFSIDLAMRF